MLAISGVRLTSRLLSETVILGIWWLILRNPVSSLTWIILSRWNLTSWTVLCRTILITPLGTLFFGTPRLETGSLVVWIVGVKR